MIRVDFLGYGGLQDSKFIDYVSGIAYPSRPSLRQRCS